MSPPPSPYAGAGVKSLLLDTNLLLVSLVGQFGPGCVEQFKRTSNYSTTDFDLIQGTISRYAGVCTTPHVIVEVSNLLDHLGKDRRTAARNLLASFADDAPEYFVKSAEVVFTPAYLKLGVTDAALYHIANQHDLVLLTADLELYHYASGLGVQAVNFNHLRQEWLLGGS